MFDHPQAKTRGGGGAPARLLVERPVSFCAFGGDRSVRGEGGSTPASNIRATPKQWVWRLSQGQRERPHPRRRRSPEGGGGSGHALNTSRDVGLPAAPCTTTLCASVCGPCAGQRALRTCPSRWAPAAMRRQSAAPSGLDSCCWAHHSCLAMFCRPEGQQAYAL